MLPLILLVCLVVGCVGGSNLPSRSGAGVLTTSDGSMYMVLTPCDPTAVDEISLMYVPVGVAPGDSSLDEVVIRYEAAVPLSAADVIAPLNPLEPAPVGLVLVEQNEELLASALVSEKSSTFDDRFYVEASGRLPDGRIPELSSSWASDMSRPDSVVLRNEVFSDPASRHCGRSEQIGWNLSNATVPTAG